MKFMDSVTVSEQPKLLSELVAARGYKGDMAWRAVSTYTSDDNTVFVKKKLAANEAAPANDGTVGIPIPAIGVLPFNVLQLDSIWTFTKAGSGSKQLYLIEDDPRNA